MRRFAPQHYTGLDETGLEKATDAFRRGDFARAVAACLTAEIGLSVRTIAYPEGPAWTVTGHESTVFVFVELVPMQLVIEAPMARLPRTQRVAAMRFALELCEDERLSSRICLRDDLLVMRFVTQLGAAPPALLRHLVHEMATVSERYSEVFMAAFNARAPTRGELQSTAESVGKKRQLGTLRPSTPRAQSVQPPPATQRPDLLPSRDDDMPPILSPVFGGENSRRVSQEELPPILTPPSMMRDQRRPSASSDDIPAILAPPSMSRDARRVASSDDIPAILAPPREPGKPLSFDDMPAVLAPAPMHDPGSSDVWDSMPPVLMPPEAITPQSRSAIALSVPSGAPSEREISPTTARLGAIPAVMMTTPNTGSATRQRTALGLSDPARPVGGEADGEMSGRRSLSPDKPVTPADKLCELLQRAQVLATALSFAERQATTLLLVRAVVYRAVYDFGETVPDAVSYLSRTTAAATRMIWSSTAPPDKNAPMPMAEPSLLAMERVVAQRAQMPKEPKLSTQAFTTAGQAREHLSKYVEEIEQSPNDQPLRHFLALGALCELLVRARLPSQTSQKIKDIVAHAQREAAKPASSLDLMMAALKRIITG